MPSATTSRARLTAAVKTMMSVSIHSGVLLVARDRAEFEAKNK